jgi:rhamnogalacturonan endolyase
LFLITENEGHTVRFQTPGVGMHDARTGELLWSHSPGVDVGSGLTADIDPRYPGYEAWGGPGGLRKHLGEEIAPAPRLSRWAIWWDGDRLRELMGRNGVYKWDWEKAEIHMIEPVASGRSLERPCFTGDILGDWREEILTVAPDGKSLRLYSTTIPTEERMITLLQDPQYRLALAWQNVAYNKPPHPSFYLGHDSNSSRSESKP